jgi:hypothetical protein
VILDLGTATEIDGYIVETMVVEDHKVIIESRNRKVADFANWMSKLYSQPKSFQRGAHKVRANPSLQLFNQPTSRLEAVKNLPPLDAEDDIHGELWYTHYKKAVPHDSLYTEYLGCVGCIVSKY